VIARRALQAVAHESDERGPKTILTEAACAYFHVGLPEDLSTAIYAPAITKRAARRLWQIRNRSSAVRRRSGAQHHD